MNEVILMKFFVKVILLSLLPFLSCENKNEEQIVREIQKFNYKYATTGNKSFLDSAYVVIDDNKYRINNSNFGLFYPVYFELGKYEELLSLINNSEDISESKKEFYINILQAYINFQNNNKRKAKYYIEKNIVLINDKLSSTPKDSLALLDLYKMKVHTDGIVSVIKEIDSLKETTIKPSSVFYDKILIPEIRSYYEELPQFVKR